MNDNDIKELFSYTPTKFDYVRSYIYRFFEALFNFRTYKFAYQKMTRGFSDVDLWGLNSHLAQLIYPRIKAFRKMRRHTTPVFEDESFEELAKSSPSDDYDREERWYDILKEIEFSFRYLLYEDDLLNKKDRKDFEKTYGIPWNENQMTMARMVYEKLNDKYEEGMRLFSLYFMDLWD